MKSKTKSRITYTEQMRKVTQEFDGALTTHLEGDEKSVIIFKRNRTVVLVIPAVSLISLVLEDASAQSKSAAPKRRLYAIS